MATVVKNRNTLHHPVIKFINGCMLPDIVNFTLFQDLLNYALFFKVVDLIVNLLALRIQHRLAVQK